MQGITDNVMRERVYKKTSGKCFYCGRNIVLNGGSRKKDYMTCDHLIPRSKGGNAHFHNLVPSCKRCNRIKGDTKTIEQFRFELTMDHFQKRYGVRFTQKHISFLKSIMEIHVPIKKFIFHYENHKNLYDMAEPLLLLKENQY